MKTVIFACVHSAGRSQMAAAYFNLLADPTVVHAVAAGTQPAAKVHPEVVQVMNEVGIDLQNATPTLLTASLAGTADLLVTMGCGESCPVLPGVRRDDWALADPKGQPLEVVREIRDSIRAKVEALIVRQGWRANSAALAKKS